MQYSCRSGNMKLLEDKNTIIIDNNFNITLLEDLLRDKLHEINNLTFDLILSNEQIYFNI